MGSAVLNAPLVSPEEPVAIIPAVQRAWSVPAKIAFRFVCAWLVLHIFPGPIGYLPFDITRAYSKWQIESTVALSQWTEVHLLGKTPVPFAYTGSADTLEAYARQLNFFLLAIAIAALWSVLDRRRPNYRKLSEWLRVWIRIDLATTIFGYGFAKLIPSQFPTPSLERYVQPLGEFSPMGLLWTFMGHSLPYNIFTGSLELLGALLLLNRRTATLGALVLIGVMANVAMLNFAYDVPVKLFSLELILLATYVAAPDLARLTDMLILNKGTAAAPYTPLIASAGVRRAAYSLAALYMAYIAWFNISDDRETVVETAREIATAPLYGIYDVEEFQLNGVTMPPLLTDSMQWRRIVFSTNQRVTIRTMSDSVVRYRAKVDTTARTLALTIAPPSDVKLTFGYLRPDSIHVVLHGMWGADTLTARLRRMDEKKFLLVSRGFHWIQEKPFNR